MHGRKQRSHARDHLGLERHLCAHLNGGARHLAAALGEMNVTREKPTAVDKARKQQRGADHRLLGVEIAAVLPWRNGANTLVLRRTIGTAKIRRQGINGLRGQRRAARVSERLLPFEPRLKLRLARQDADPCP